MNGLLAVSYEGSFLNDIDGTLQKRVFIEDQTPVVCIAQRFFIQSFGSIFHSSLVEQGFITTVVFLKAIKTGEIHAVYYLPGFSWMGVAPFANATEQVSIAARRAQESEQRNPGQEFSDDLLPRGVVFASGEAVQDARAAQAVADIAATSSNVKLVLFYPDGTSQDARIYLENDKGDLRQIELRGLTGTASSSKVERVGR